MKELHVWNCLQGRELKQLAEKCNSAHSSPWTACRLAAKQGLRDPAAEHFRLRSPPPQKSKIQFHSCTANQPTLRKGLKTVHILLNTKSLLRDWQFLTLVRAEGTFIFKQQDKIMEIQAKVRPSAWPRGGSRWQGTRTLTSVSHTSYTYTLGLFIHDHKMLKMQIKGLFT